GNPPPLPDHVRFSPDGKMVAFLAPFEIPNDPQPGEVPPQCLCVAKVKDTNSLMVGVAARSFAWSPDGRDIAYTNYPDPKKLVAEHGMVNVKPSNRTVVKVLKLPPDQYITDWHPDGKHFLTTRQWPKAGLVLVSLDGKEQKPLTDPEKLFAVQGRFSPDGSKVLCLRVTPPKKGEEGPAKQELMVLELNTGKTTLVTDVPPADALAYAWSPDGKRIAYTWREKHAGKPEEVTAKETESRLVTCNPDGGNKTVLMKEKGKGQWHATLMGVDWR
ncbi:MAG TPA: hypothetical protein VLM40_20420, partial [Gemmata sp.]|nr:hypothetical protein [Gemmata sp.]